MNRYLWYLWYNLAHKQIALVINNYFKFDTATGKLASQREQFCFCTYTYWHHLENLSYQTHTKLWALKSSCEGTFLTKQLSETIVVCSALRVNCLVRGIVPLIDRTPINIDNDDEHHTHLMHRQGKMTETMIFQKSLCLFL